MFAVANGFVGAAIVTPQTLVIQRLAASIVLALLFFSRHSFSDVSLFSFLICNLHSQKWTSR